MNCKFCHATSDFTDYLVTCILQEKLRIAVLVSKAAFQFIQGENVQHLQTVSSH